MKEKKGEHPFGDAGQLIWLGLFLVLWGADTFVFHWSTFLSAWVPQVIRWTVLGVAIVAALALVRFSHFVISGQERPNQVVESGAFRYVRHPLYLAALLSYFGAAFSSMSLLGLALCILIFIFYNYIATYEEKLLETKLGDAYRSYETKTGKWLPRLGRS